MTLDRIVSIFVTLCSAIDPIGIASVFAAFATRFAAGRIAATIIG